ncbi:MAG TPA: SDR family NAD(P)-dependent oxidoreductase [Thermoanaerobaculia bacterium]|nr:SDR family NAD(P)-dependent oxidoreductase [Thermoanaerobaculia bacterium]
MNHLAGKVALVTGGSGAIGGAILEALHDAGATAVSLDVTPTNGFPWIACDVRDDASVAAAVESALDTYERIDIAVHAAGISRDAVVWKLAVDDWDAVLEVNLRGAFSLLRHTIPAMRSSGGGRIVLIGSINGSRGKFGLSAYSASKAGLIGLAKSVARETGRFGITVNVIEPGWVKTPLTDEAPEAVRQKALDETLGGEFAEPHDIADATVFLCGARRITGQILRVDAGQCV